MYALDLLDKDYQIPYPNYSIGGTNIRNTIINRPIKIIDLINNENKSANDLEALKEELKIFLLKTMLRLECFWVEQLVLLLDFSEVVP